MGARGYTCPELDDLLRVHLEGRQIHWQIGLCYIHIPAHHASRPARPRRDSARRRQRHRVLRQARLESLSQPRCKNKQAIFGSF